MQLSSQWRPTMHLAVRGIRLQKPGRRCLPSGRAAEVARRSREAAPSEIQVLHVQRCDVNVLCDRRKKRKAGLGSGKLTCDAFNEFVIGSWDEDGSNFSPGTLQRLTEGVTESGEERPKLCQKAALTVLGVSNAWMHQGKKSTTKSTTGQRKITRDKVHSCC